LQIEVFLNSVKPLIDEGIEQCFLLYLQIVPSSVKHSKCTTRIVFKNLPSITVAY